MPIERLPAGEQGITDTDLISLDTAARLGFPEGYMTPRGLRKEVAKGRLEAAKIGGKVYTTLRSVRKLALTCRVIPKDHDCVLTQKSGTPKQVSSVEKPNGSSVMEKASIARAAALKIAQELSKP